MRTAAVLKFIARINLKKFIECLVESDKLYYSICDADISKGF